MILTDVHSHLLQMACNFRTKSTNVIEKIIIKNAKIMQFAFTCFFRINEESKIRINLK